MSNTQKAYKLLSIQEGISNRAAKELIDRGLVYLAGKKITVARSEIAASAKFKVEKLKKPYKLFEDENLLVLDKPPFLTSEEISQDLKIPLLHRLDRETSGVLLLVKNEEFRLKAIEEFKKERVEKDYIAWIEGVLAERIEINEPILTIKGKNAYSKVSKDGKPAVTIIEPLMIEGKRTKIKATIKTGRTHQIRAHLKHLGFPILGDEKYGGRNYSRIMLHSQKIKIFNYIFEADEPKEFWQSNLV